MLVLEVVDEAFCLSEGCNEAVVADQVSDVLELLADLLFCASSPCLVLGLLLLQFQQLGVVLLNVLLVLVLELGNEADSFLMRLRNDLNLLVNLLQTQQRLFDLFVMQVVKIFSLGLTTLVFDIIRHDKITFLAFFAVVAIDLNPILDDRLF